jgi:hypothetical protein
MNFKPRTDKAILKAKKVFKYEKNEKGKNVPVTDGAGNHAYDLNDFYVEESGIDGVKKGKKVIVIIGGGVPVKEMETKTHVFLVIDSEDIYAQAV